MRSRRGQYRVAVEVGDHEPAGAAQHLAHVQVAVALDDRGARERAEPAQDCLDLAAAGTRDAMLAESRRRTDGFQSLERGVTPARRVLARGDGGCAGQGGVQFGDQVTDFGGRLHRTGARRWSRAASVISPTAQVQPSTAPGRYSSTFATSVSALSRRLPGDQTPRRGHAGEPGVAQHADPPRRRVRPLLQMGRPFDHRGIADDHRLVGLVDTDPLFAHRRSLGPRLNGEPPRVAEPRTRASRSSRASAAPSPERARRHRPSSSRTMGTAARPSVVGDDREALAVGEIERVERLSQPTPDAEHPPAR